MGLPDHHRPGGLRLGVPFTAVHLGVLAIALVGWSAISLAAAALLYSVRALGITVVYHRGLAHRAFRMRRPMQAIGSVVAASAAQRGPLWWVAHHRQHHRHADRPGDPHSPVVDGLLRSHLLWMFADATQACDEAAVPDLTRYPELRVLDRYHYAAPVALAVATLVAGTLVGHVAPGAGVTGPQLLVWGFCVSTVALWHSTFAVNSLGHRFGRRRFETRDDSRNLWWLALLTMGEGWHNNHHRFPTSARHGLARHELDPSWWLIRALAGLGLARDLRVTPVRRSGASRASPAELELSASDGPGRR
jgi:stearoyl-CoA desaturase (Delta-9 desaturase)